MTMAGEHKIKPVGGVCSAAVVPAGTAVGNSPQEIIEAAVGIPIMEDRTSYEERISWKNGIARTEHLLTVTVARDYAQEHFTARVQRHWAREGTAAVIRTAAGELIVAGWSERFGAEQPLRLVSMDSTTALSPRDTPTSTLLFRSVDDSPAQSV